jgi:sterol desaturase/sphingolipid hydroxylase (fatty acid hydroxylase superfamily)
MYGRWRDGRSFDLGRMTFRELLVAFATHPAIHAYAALALASSIAAVAWAESGWRTLAAAVVTLLAYPLVEYLVHRFVLHNRFLYRNRFTAALWKRVHFDHHQDPHRLDVLFGSLANTLPTIAAIAIPLGWLVGGGRAGAAAAFATGLVAMSLYELCHSMQHLNYQPRSRYLRRIKQAHLAHHFHHEQGNFGITGFLVDRIFGTYYATPQEKPRSPTAFNLGYDRAEAERFPWVADLSGAPPREGPPHRGAEDAKG